MGKRDTYKYEFTKGNKVVYVGITSKGGRNHQDKDFDKMRIIGNALTFDGSSQWKANRIQTYMANHNATQASMVVNVQDTIEMTMENNH